MKRYIRTSQELIENYTDQDLISAINKAAKTKRQVDIAIANEALGYVLDEGDQIVIEESDGKMYPYTLTRKSDFGNGKFRLEFTANLSKDLAYETNGYVVTTNIIGQLVYITIPKGRRWYLNLQ